MNLEREFRYIGFNLEEMLVQFSRLAQPHVFKFSRAVFDIPNTNGWLRLRTDGHVSILTVKSPSSETAGEFYESEIQVDNYENTLTLLALLGYRPRSVQKNFRILFKINSCDITIDLWPEIQPLIEIEGKCVSDIEQAETIFRDLKPYRTEKTITDLYRDVGIDIKHVKLMDFKTEPAIIKKFLN
jgi:adenylate cyclase, class 2